MTAITTNTEFSLFGVQAPPPMEIPTVIVDVFKAVEKNTSDTAGNVIKIGGDAGGKLDKVTEKIETGNEWTKDILWNARDTATESASKMSKVTDFASKAISPITNAAASAAATVGGVYAMNEILGNKLGQVNDTIDQTGSNIFKSVHDFKRSFEDESPKLITANKNTTDSVRDNNKLSERANELFSGAFDVGVPNHQASSSDGRMTQVFKSIGDQENKATKGVSADVKNESQLIRDTFKVMNINPNVTDRDSMFTRMLKNNHNLLYDQVATLNSVYNISNDRDLTIGNGDSQFVRLMKNTTRTTNDEINKSVGSFQRAYDKGFNDFVKGVTPKISNLDMNLGQVRTLGDDFKVGSTDVSSSNRDGRAVQLAKNLQSRARDDVRHDIKSFRDFFNSGSTNVNSNSSYDGPLTKLYKSGNQNLANKLDSLRNEIKNQSGNNQGQTNVDFGDLIKSNGVEFKNLGDQIKQNGIDTINTIGKLPAQIGDLVTGLVIPQTSGYFPGKVNQVSKKARGKWRKVDESFDEIKDLFNVPQKNKFDDLQFNFTFGNLYGVNAAKKINVSHFVVNFLLNSFKFLFTGFLLYTFLIDQYVYFREKGSVLE